MKLRRAATRRWSSRIRRAQPAPSHGHYDQAEAPRPGPARMRNSEPMGRSTGAGRGTGDDRAIAAGAKNRSLLSIKMTRPVADGVRRYCARSTVAPIDKTIGPNITANASTSGESACLAIWTRGNRDWGLRSSGPQSAPRPHVDAAAWQTTTALPMGRQ